MASPYTADLCVPVRGSEGIQGLPGAVGDPMPRPEALVYYVSQSIAETLTGVWVTSYYVLSLAQPWADAVFNTAMTSILYQPGLYSISVTIRRVGSLPMHGLVHLPSDTGVKLIVQKRNAPDPYGPTIKFVTPVQRQYILASQADYTTTFSYLLTVADYIDFLFQVVGGTHTLSPTIVLEYDISVARLAVLPP